MLIIIIIKAGVIRNMNKISKYSYFEDLERINSGYEPKTHFMSLYNIILMFMVSKLLIYRGCKNFIAGLFNYGKLHKECPNIIPFGVYDHPR